MGPSAVHCPLQTECVCECDGKAAKALNPNFARCTEMVSVTGIFYASELDNGADDYLTKPFSVDELLARLRVTQRRLNLLASDGINSPVFVNGPLKIDFSAGCVWLSENELHLTPIEYKLLCVLAHNVGKVLTHTSLTQKVWGSTQENDIASLRVYMASLRKKLERCPDAPHLIQTHVGVGYRMLRMENDEA